MSETSPSLECPFCNRRTPPYLKPVIPAHYTCQVCNADFLPPPTHPSVQPDVEKAHVHNWIGNTCSRCGVAYHLWIEDEVKSLQQQLAKETAKVVSLLNVCREYGWNGIENSKCADTFLRCLIEDLKQQLAEKTAEVERVRKHPDDCPNCPNQGWYSIERNGEQEQDQCEWCYTIPYSKFNQTQLQSQLTTAEARVKELESPDAFMTTLREVEMRCLDNMEGEDLEGFKKWERAAVAAHELILAITAANPPASEEGK